MLAHKVLLQDLLAHPVGDCLLTIISQAGKRGRLISPEQACYLNSEVKDSGQPVFSQGMYMVCILQSAITKRQHSLLLLVYTIMLLIRVSHMQYSMNSTRYERVRHYNFRHLSDPIRFQTVQVIVA